MGWFRLRGRVERKRPAGTLGVLGNLVVLAIFGSLTANAAPPELLSSQLPFIRMDPATGLALKSISSIAQDRQGFLWVGLTDGLGRYDGHGFVVFGAPESLTHPTVVDITVGTAGELWVATAGGGLNRCDPQTEVFSAIRYDPDEVGGAVRRSLPSDVLSAVAQTRDGLVWAGSFATGLSRIDPATGEIRVYRHREDVPASLSDDRILRLFVDHQQQLWVGTAAGLDRYVVGEDRFERIQGLAGLEIPGIVEGPEGSLWVASSRGLYRLDTQTLAMTSYRHDPNDPTSLDEDALQDVVVDPNGRVWVATENLGIDRLQDEGGFVHERHRPGDVQSLYYGHVLRLFFDRSGVLWVGSDRGLLQNNPLSRVFSRHVADPEDPTALPARDVLAMHEDRQGDLWIGTRGQGLAVRRADGIATAAELSFPQELHDADVAAFYEDQAGDLWIGTNYLGLFRRRANGRVVLYEYDSTDPKSLAGNDITDIHEDTAGRFWVGSWGGGLNLLDRDTGEVTRDARHGGPLPDIGAPAAFVFHESPPGVLWVGTWTAGFSRLDLGDDPLSAEVRSYRYDPEASSSLRSNRVHAFHGELTRDGDLLTGDLWVGTWGGGLHRMDVAGETFEILTVADGLPSDSIYNILEDERGVLWISTTQGIASYDPATQELQAFDSSDGIQERLFFYHCALKLRDGRMIFCGGDATSFDPTEVEANDYLPRVALTDLEIGGEKISRLRQDGLYELAWRDRFVRLKVAALDFTAPSKNQYAYRLAGVTEDWIAAEREITFPNLPSGDNVLEIQGSNSHGKIRGRGLTLTLRVTPPWWQTWTFRSFLGLLLALATYGVYAVRMRFINTRLRALEQIEIRSRELEQEVLRRRDVELALAELVTELEKKNDELTRFSSTIAHDFKSPLFTVSSFTGYALKGLEKGNEEAVRKDLQRVRAAAQAMDQQLRALYDLAQLGTSLQLEENVSLEELAEQAVELVRGRLREKRIQVEISPDLPMVMVDRSRMLQVFQNLIDNAAKFARTDESVEPKIEIRSQFVDGEGVIQVRDNGIGLDEIQLERVFDLFHRVDKSIEGTGVGLAFVKRIIESHGGRVWVESDGRDQGATFSFVLEGGSGAIPIRRSRRRR